MKRTIYLGFFCLITGVEMYAQSAKQTTNTQQIWLAYMNQSRLTGKLGLWTDVHLRTKEDFTTDLSQFIARLGLMYYLNDNTKLTAGYAFINHFPTDNHKNISAPEHRPWQQIQWHTRYGSLRTMQWIRLEERFRRKVANDDNLAQGYNFNYRVRYNFLLTIPLSKKGIAKGKWSYILNDELHINAGKEIINNYFDQNRFFTGFALHTNPHDNLQIGYMNVFQQLAAGNRYRSIHTFRVFYFHNIDFRKK